MSQKWLRAAARYEAQGKDGFKPRRKKQKPPVPTLVEFMRSPEWSEAKTLLAASGAYIVVSRLNGSIHIILTKRGLEGETPTGVKRISATNATKRLALVLHIQRESRANSGNSNRDLAFPVLRIREQLDDIADNAP